MGWEDAKDVDVPEEYTKKYKVTKKDLNQYEDVLNHAEAFMMDDKVDPEDKQKLFEIVSKLYWESKATNKEKYGKKKGNK
jgi:GTPase involved in cell partitioning and DNA repair